MPKLNPNDKEAWEAEVNFYGTSSVPSRAIRALELGFANTESYCNYMRRHRIYLSVPTSRREKFNKPEIVRESCLVLFDSQVPFHDGDFINHLLELAADWGIRQGVSGGDLLNMTSFSRFYENPEDKVWKRERDEGIKVLTAMSEMLYRSGSWSKVITRTSFSRN